MLLINLLAGFRHAPTQVINMSDEDNVLDTGEAEVVADENHAGEATPETPPESDEVKAIRGHYEKELSKRDAKFQKRIDKATRDKGDELRARMASLEEAILNKGKPQEKQSVSRDDFQSDNDYVEAISEGVTKAKIQEYLAEVEAKKEREAVATKSEKILAEAMKIGNFDADDFVGLPPVIANILLDSEIPAKIVAHLQLNPDDLERISNLSPAKQVIEIGKLEGRLADAKPVKSNAPKPISPISGSSAKNLEYRPDMTDEEFDRWTAQQHKLRR